MQSIELSVQTFWLSFLAKLKHRRVLKIYAIVNWEMYIIKNKKSNW